MSEVKTKALVTPQRVEIEAVAQDDGHALDAGPEVRIGQDGQLLIRQERRNVTVLEVDVQSSEVMKHISDNNLKVEQSKSSSNVLVAQAQAAPQLATAKAQPWVIVSGLATIGVIVGMGTQAHAIQSADYVKIVGLLLLALTGGGAAWLWSIRSAAAGAKREATPAPEEPK